MLDDKLYNCAVAIKSGIVLGVVPKSYLPSYKEFYEQRWFACAEVAHSKEIEVLGRTVQFGNDLLFHTDSVEGLSIAVDVCEDLVGRDSAQLPGCPERCHADRQPVGQQRIGRQVGIPS